MLSITASAAAVTLAMAKCAIAVALIWEIVHLLSPRLTAVAGATARPADGVAIINNSVAKAASKAKDEEQLTPPTQPAVHAGPVCGAAVGRWVSRHTSPGRLRTTEELYTATADTDTDTGAGTVKATTVPIGIAIETSTATATATTATAASVSIATRPASPSTATLCAGSHADPVVPAVGLLDVPESLRSTIMAHLPAKDLVAAERTHRELLADTRRYAMDTVRQKYAERRLPLADLAHDEPVTWWSDWADGATLGPLGIQPPSLTRVSRDPKKLRAPPNGFWMRELWAWENAVQVPSEEYATVQDAAGAAPPGAHVLVAAGMHVVPQTLVINKRLQLLGEASADGSPLTTIKGQNLQQNHSVVRAAHGGRVGLCGIAVWCYASDSLRRSSVSVDAGGHLYARQVGVKCVSGRYSAGVQVHEGGHLLMHTCSVRCCTGSGVIIFGSGTLQGTTLCDNWFNGVEIQKRGSGGRGSLTDCHIHSNGYSSNEDDLGSGVTVFGEGCEANLRRCAVHSNKGGGVLVHSGAKGALQNCQITMNHAGFEFGDVDVDTSSEVVLDECECRGNGEHGREQYRVLAVQDQSKLTLRACTVRCQAGAFGTGIEVQRGASLDVSHSKIHGCTGSGMLLRDEDTKATIHHSILEDNDLHGLEVQAGSITVDAQTHVANNKVHNIYISGTNGECQTNIDFEGAPIFRDFVSTKS